MIGDGFPVPQEKTAKAVFFVYVWYNLFNIAIFLKIIYNNFMILLTVLKIVPLYGQMHLKQGETKF